jgi:DNA-binding PadR family transcriptional regulator
VNLTRLMVLSVLDGHGERHGHQLRRDAEQTDVARWGGVNVGALYRELQAMATEGLVTAIRTEQVGRRPARTVYGITDAGRRELDRLREEAIGDIIGGPDAAGVALTFGGDNAPVRALLSERLRALKQARAGVVAERRRLLDEGLIDAWTAALFDRRRLMFEAEIRWLERLPPRDGD